MIDHVIALAVMAPLRERKYVRLLMFAIMAVLAAYVSVAQQGYAFGVMNNVFHIPLALRWADDPVFADDHFIQTLRNITAPVWLGVQLFSDESNVELVFYLLQLLTRAAALASLAWASASMGVCGLFPRILLMLWFGIAPGMRWETAIGSGGIFGFSFSHSELYIPLTVIALTLAVQRRYLLAFSSLGLLANINAFSAAWAGWALVGVAVGDKDLRQTMVRSIGGLIIAAILAAPVAIWIFSVIRGDPVSGAEHERYLREYFPFHSMLAGQSPVKVALFAAQAVSALISFRLLASAGKGWSRATFALCGLVVGGMVLPELVSSRLLLDLHLLRASALIQMLAVLGGTVAAISTLRGSSATERIGGLLALCLLALPALQGTVLAGPVMLAARRNDWRLVLVLSAPLVIVAYLTMDYWPAPILISGEIVATVLFITSTQLIAQWRPPRFGTSVAIVAAVVASVAGYSYKVHQSIQHQPDREDGLAIAKWARDSTPKDSIFLVPEAASSPFPADIFGSLSHRRVWVDWKRGGAVMWAPSYYEEWSRRMREVGALLDLAAKLTYACKNHIDYVVVASTANAPVNPIFQTGHFQVFDPAHWCRELK